MAHAIVSAISTDEVTATKRPANDTVTRGVTTVSHPHPSTATGAKSTEVARGWVRPSHPKISMKKTGYPLGAWQVAAYPAH